MISKRSTIGEVAAFAGVSTQTVSRVVNGGPNISAKTRAKVEAAITTLDFRPNAAARSLRQDRAYTLGLVAEAFISAYFMEVIRGAAGVCKTHGYHLVLQEVSPGDLSAIAKFERDLKHASYDGLILLPTINDDPALLDVLDRVGTRYVRLAPATDVDRSPSVFADDEKGAAEIAQLFWNTGHRRIGLVMAAESHVATHLRRKGFMDAWIKMGGSPDQVIQPEFNMAYFSSVVTRVAAGDLSSAKAHMKIGKRASLALLAARDRPTALFLFNDQMAAGAIYAAHEQGLEVPKDVAITGFDDSEAASLVRPALTTVRQPIAEMAAEAAKMLISPSKDNDFPSKCLPVQFIRRQSA